MLEFQEKRKIKKFIYSKITLFILLVLILLTLKATWGVYTKYSLTKENMEKSATNAEKLLARQDFLESEIDRLQTPAGVEQEIREKYGLVKEGEEVIVILPAEQEIDVKAEAPKSWWQKMKFW